MFKKRIIIWTTFQGRLKLALVAVLLLMAAMIFTYELPSKQVWSAWSMPLSGRVIAIDAGHGGPDGGADSEGVIEKDITLSVALYLRDFLQQSGAVVVMTRETDKDLAEPDLKGLSKRKTQDLRRRVKLIQNKKADLLVSIHVNSFPSGKWSGAQTFYSTSNQDSKPLAALIQKELIRNLGNTDRSIKPDSSIYLLKALKIPSSLVELGFISNDKERSQMTDPKYQKKLAASIYQGIIRYYSGEKAGVN